MSANGKQSLVIRNGTLIDSKGGPPVENDAIVVEGNRITSVGPVPGGMNLEDTEKVRVIDASGQWIPPGLIDGPPVIWPARHAWSEHRQGNNQP